MDRPIAFVIMSFAPEHQGIYDAVIKPTLEEDLGWRCWRVDEQPGAGSIVRQIVVGIANAALVVADLTALRPNVLYELGVAHTLGTPVLTLFRKGGDSMPFELRAYHYIEYEDSAAGARRLSQAIITAIRALPQWGTQPSNPVQDFLPAERRNSTPISPASLPTTPAEQERLRELAYVRELATAVRRRLHHLQLTLANIGTGVDPVIIMEAEDLDRQLNELRIQIATLENRH